MAKTVESNVFGDKVVVLMPTYESGVSSVYNLVPLLGDYDTDWCWVEVDDDKSVLVPRHLMGTSIDALDCRVVGLIEKYLQCVEDGEFDERPLNDECEVAVETDDAILVCPLHECLGIGECDCDELVEAVYEKYHFIEDFYTQLM